MKTLNISHLHHVPLATEGCEDANFMDVRHAKLYGYHSGNEAHFRNVQIIEGKGYESLMGAYIDSADLEDMDVYAFGAHSAYRAIVVCQPGAHCRVDCQGDGCEAMKFVCYDGADCKLPNGCTSTNTVREYNGVICPKVTTSLIGLTADTDTTHSVDREKQIDLVDPHSSPLSVSAHSILRAECYETKECVGEDMDGVSYVDCHGLGLLHNHLSKARFAMLSCSIPKVFELLSRSQHVTLQNRVLGPR